VPALKKIWYVRVPAIAMLAILLVAMFLIAPAFAHASPDYGNAANNAQIGDRPIELAQADLPPVGSLNDYMHQEGDGPTTAPSSPRYSPQSLPPPGYTAQSLPPPEWNNRYADPNMQRNLLIGAAVVGAIAVGMWAYQQHQQHQTQRRTRKRLYGRRYGFIE